eukprot:gnl/Hemi2/13245_TR4535_c0_g1_i1.p2 gnl/Hemi2/13245_TR4535_c0_g1~~gnl/Hemi2/13245_TR4535_c0_g1_i1.p2  ORF type:complete len:389 (+),score=146.64 gnl/Hemi2/13245_TR4535_c0_g1_i1:88-1254(+)
MANHPFLLVLVLVAAAGVAAVEVNRFIDHRAASPTASSDAGSAEMVQLFARFKSVYSKKYASQEEEDLRQLVFAANVAQLRVADRLHPGHTLGITKFSDLTREEFRSAYLGKNNFTPPAGLAAPPRVSVPVPATSAQATPNFQFSWVDKGIVTPPKNQAAFAVCWAFATIGAIESAVALKHGAQVLLSEEELIDCGKDCSGDQGCASTNYGFNDALHNLPTSPGVVSEASLPYQQTAHNTTCTLTPSSPVAGSIVGIANLAQDENQIMTYVQNNGPVAAGMNAEWLSGYTAGVISNPWMCSAASLDHAVLIVGFGTTNQTHTGSSVDYWLIKNSWGSNWGETPDCYLAVCTQTPCPACQSPTGAGYFRLSRGSNTCGIATHVVGVSAK